jgi:two-component system sensor histidine kinase QseC
MTAALAMLRRWARPTIGQRVLLALLAAFFLVWAMLVLYFYIQFRQQLAVDQGLKKFGRALTASLVDVRDEADAVTVMKAAAKQFDTLRISGSPGGSTLMQLRERSEQGDGPLVYASPNLGTRQLEGPLGQVIEADIGDSPYWVYGSDAGRWTLHLAEPPITGAWVVERNAGRVLPHLLLAFPLVLLPVWFAVRHGLRPLQQLADRIARRGKTDLSPIGFDPPYAELKPLTAALERMLRQLRDKVAQERAFVHDAAHELRTPMAVIAAQAHALAGASNAAERESAQLHLEQAIARASHLTQQLLDLALLDDAQGAAPKRIDLAQFARQLIAQAVPQAMARGIELTFDAPDSLQADIDVPAFQSVLENLLHNAIRYVHDGAQVAVTLRSDADGLLLTVVDDGPGIPAAERSKVFERFYRGAGGAGSATQEASGSGLGLAIVMQAVHRMRGQVAIAEGLVPARGVGFRVLLPLPTRA